MRSLIVIIGLRSIIRGDEMEALIAISEALLLIAFVVAVAYVAFLDKVR